MMSSVSLIIFMFVPQVAMTIAAAVLLWVAIVLSATDVFKGRRAARRVRSPQMSEKCVRVYFSPVSPLKARTPH